MQQGKAKRPADDFVIDTAPSRVPDSLQLPPSSTKAPRVSLDHIHDISPSPKNGTESSEESEHESDNNASSLYDVDGYDQDESQDSYNLEEGQVLDDDDEDKEDVDDFEADDIDDAVITETSFDKERGRYFADPDAADAMGPTKKCALCHSTGHIVVKCPHTTCALCGVLDSHEKTHCPFNLVCWRCGEHGHRSRVCQHQRWELRCEKCKVTHFRRMCPLYWRNYLPYQSESQKPRPPKKLRKYCYNCAGSTHFGDECPLRRANQVNQLGPSAFTDNSLTNLPPHHQRPNIVNGRPQQRPSSGGGGNLTNARSENQGEVDVEPEENFADRIAARDAKLPKNIPKGPKKDKSLSSKPSTKSDPTKQSGRQASKSLHVKFPPSQNPEVTPQGTSKQKNSTSGSLPSPSLNAETSTPSESTSARTNQTQVSSSNLQQLKSLKDRILAPDDTAPNTSSTAATEKIPPAQRLLQGKHLQPIPSNGSTETGVPDAAKEAPPPLPFASSSQNNTGADNKDEDKLTTSADNDLLSRIGKKQQQSDEKNTKTTTKKGTGKTTGKGSKKASKSFSGSATNAVSPPTTRSTRSTRSSKAIADQTEAAKEGEESKDEASLKSRVSDEQQQNIQSAKDKSDTTSGRSLSKYKGGYM